MALNSMYTEASFLPTSTDLLRLQLAQVPIDLQIWQFLCPQRHN